MIRLIRAEFTKLTTTRLIYGLAAAMAAFGVLTVVVGVTTAGQQGNPPLSADSLPMLIGGPVTQLAGPALLLGILGMAGEFRHQTVTQTFLVTPDRGRVVAAKLVAYPLAGIALALVTLAVTAAVAAGWLAAKGITPSLPDARHGAALVGVVLLGAALCGLVGVGVAALVRNQVAALVGVAVWVLVVEGLLLSLLNAPSLGKWLPSAAAAAITSPGGAHLSRLGGTLLLAAYALALALVGTRLVVRRDIT
jgi:ABC-type transport system involved in multi-copper enzyme maturation permease subunit